MTTIPTYWAPQLTVRKRLAEIMPPDPPAVPPKRARAPRPQVVIDKPPECMAIYLVSMQNNILAYNPLDHAFEERGRLECPAGPWAHPFSMGVTREGIAHVVYSDGRLYEVDLDDMRCRRTEFTPNQEPGFWQFGMGYAPTPDGEALYVAEISHVRPSKGLARVDTRTGELHYIGSFSLNPGFDIELTPTGDGPLYGFFLNAFSPGGTLVEIDTSSAIIKRSYHVDVGSHSQALAIAWWGGQFYIFTSRGTGSVVDRFDPKTEKVARVATIDQRIVGAGVSTCAPSAADLGEQASASGVRP